MFSEQGMFLHLQPLVSMWAEATGPLQAKPGFLKLLQGLGD